MQISIKKLFFALLALSFCACSKPDKNIAPKIYIDARPAPACVGDEENDYELLKALAGNFLDDSTSLVRYVRHNRHSTVANDTTLAWLAKNVNSSQQNLDSGCQSFQQKYPDGIRCTSQTKKRQRVLNSANHKDLCDQTYRKLHGG